VTIDQAIDDVLDDYIEYLCPHGYDTEDSHPCPECAADAGDWALDSRGER